MIRKNTKTQDMTKRGTLVIYAGTKGGVELRADANQETIWATQEQIAGIFGIDRSVAGKHIRNILADRELDRNSVCANFAHTAKDGKQYSVIFYTLDVILAVGYRTNSTKAIRFRIWATKTLREYLIKGFKVDLNKVKNTSAGFADLRETIDFIESRTCGRVKGTVVVKLKKELM